MTIEQSANRLATFYRTYLAERDAVIKDARWAEHVRKERIAEQFQRGVSSAETALVELWGRIDTTRSQHEGYILTDEGAVWTELAALDKRQNAAREAAARVDTSEAAYGIARVKSLLTMHGNSGGLLQVYENQMSQQEQVWCQDFLAGVLERVADSGWNRVLQRLERDRAERLNTPALQAVEADIGTAITAALAAHKLSKQIANEFAHASWYCGEFMKGIEIVRTSKPAKIGRPETRVSIERVAWSGIRFVGNQFGSRVRSIQGAGGLFSAASVDGGSME